MTLYDSRGQLVRLGNQIGKGGEGTVYALADRPDIVAKTYLKTVDQQKAAKLTTMVRLKTDRILSLAAWPLDTLHDRPNGNLKGLLMPRGSGREIHALYSPKSRLKEFPRATWPFLIQAAANAARAFAVVHEHGHVIGDVNHAHLLVSDQATVRLIDCDSFQINAPGQQFLCEVGVSTHTPPELQNRSFNGVARAPHHDAFGLAVNIFLLLFMGRHPFSGGYLGRGEMSLERAIQEFRFAYGDQAASRQMKQPPGTLPLSAVSQPLALLFERAFSSDGVRPGIRPTPQEWVAALIALSRELKQCSRNPGHHFYSRLGACPWCDIETRSGILLFNFLVRATQQQVSQFNLDQIWALITAVTPPGPAPLISATNLPIVTGARQFFAWSSATG